MAILLPFISLRQPKCPLYVQLTFEMVLFFFYLRKASFWQVLIQDSFLQVIQTKLMIVAIVSRFVTEKI